MPAKSLPEITILDQRRTNYSQSNLTNPCNHQQGTYLARNGSADEKRQSIRPWEETVLLPPPRDYQIDVEPHHERHQRGSQVVLREIVPNPLERSATNTLCKSQLPSHSCVRLPCRVRNRLGTTSLS